MGRFDRTCDLALDWIVLFGVGVAEEGEVMMMLLGDGRVGLQGILEGGGWL